MLLLLRRAELDQHRPAHRKTERDQRRAARIAAFLLEDVALHHVPPRTAPLLRPGGRDPALLRQDSMPAQQVVLREVGIGRHFLAQVAGQVVAEPAARFVAEGGLFGGVVEVHGGSLIPRCKLPENEEEEPMTIPKRWVAALFSSLALAAAAQ